MKRSRTAATPIGVRSNAGLGAQFVVLGMSADSNPKIVVVDFYSHSAVVRTHAGRPELAKFLEVQRRMLEIGFEEAKVLVGEFACIRRECLIQRPKSGRREMLQSGVDFP